MKNSIPSTGAGAVSTAHRDAVPSVQRDVLLRVRTMSVRQTKASEMIGATEILERLVMKRVEQYDEAEFNALCATYRLEMPTVYSPERLQQIERELSEATTIMEANRFWHRAFWIGALESEFEARKGELEQMLHERGATDCRFAGCSVESLLDELVEVETL